MKGSSASFRLLMALCLLALACGKKATADQAAAQPTAPLPAEVAGFRFGMSVGEFEDHCRKVGKPNPLTADDGDMRKHTCDGVEVEPGMRLNMLIGFCKGDTQLCEISYWTKTMGSVSNAP